MNTKSLLIGTAAAIALTGTANAAQINGWYLGLDAGAGWIEDVDVGVVVDPDPPGLPTSLSTTLQFDTGWAVLASVGYGFGSGLRTEFETGYRHNELNNALTADFEEWSAMVNVLYDIPLTNGFALTLGGGAGGDFAQFNIPIGGFDDEEWNFAYQGIAGLSFELTNNLDLTLNYRYLRVVDLELDGRSSFPSPRSVSYDFDDVVKHTATVGLRFALGQTAAPEPYVAPPPPPPEPAAASPAEFIVFFGHNKSNLVPEALRVIAEAAAAAKQYGSASLSVVGHADRSGSDAHNDALSLRRANVVKDALAAQGIPSGAISVSSKGESEPLVPTADGVREPQNRRVNITM
jgi:OmpA-OmpF porin, OOP family